MSRYLGQHFLKNKSAINSIIQALDIQPNETVVEIGPGEGALTLPLAEACDKIGGRLIAIEKDRNLAGALPQKIKNVEVITGDALKELATPKSYILNSKSWKLVGNIPYYITGKLLRVIGELEQKPSLVVLMIQKEVAERLSAQPPSMNLLAAATQIWSKPEILLNLKPKDFNPPPEVDSSVIKLEIELKIKEKKTLEAYYRLIKVAFKQPRKTLLNNLSTGLEMPKEKILEIVKKCGLTGEERAQNLSLNDLQKLLTFLPFGN